MRIRTIWEMGLRIRDRRLELGWSQAQLADRLGTTRQWVNSLEQGNPGAALGQVLQAIEVLGLRVDVRDRRRKGPDAGRPKGSHEMSEDEFYSYLDEVVRRAREPEGGDDDPPPRGSGTPAPDPAADEPGPRTPLRRKEE